MTWLGVPDAFRKQAAEFKIQVLCRFVQVLWESVKLHFSCQAVVTELLPLDDCRWQGMVAHERRSYAVMERSAVCQQYEMGALPVCERQDTEDEIFIVIRHTHHVTHVAYVQEMERDEDLRFTIAYTYYYYSTHISSSPVNKALKHHCLHTQTTHALPIRASKQLAMAWRRSDSLQRSGP